MFQAVEAHSNLAPPLSYDLVSRQLAIPPTKIDHRDRCTTLVHYLQTTSNQHVHNSSPLDHHQCVISFPQSSPHSRLLTNGDRDGPLLSQKEIIIENIPESQPPAPPSVFEGVVVQCHRGYNQWHWKEERLIQSNNGRDVIERRPLLSVSMTIRKYQPMTC